MARCRSARPSPCRLSVADVSRDHRRSASPRFARSIQPAHFSSRAFRSASSSRRRSRTRARNALRRSCSCAAFRRAARPGTCGVRSCLQRRRPGRVAAAPRVPRGRSADGSRRHPRGSRGVCRVATVGSGFATASADRPRYPERSRDRAIRVVAAASPRQMSTRRLPARPDRPARRRPGRPGAAFPRRRATSARTRRRSRATRRRPPPRRPASRRARRRPGLRPRRPPAPTPEGARRTSPPVVSTPSAAASPRRTPRTRAASPGRAWLRPFGGRSPSPCFIVLGFYGGWLERVLRRGAAVGRGLVAHAPRLPCAYLRRLARPR
mmetsp:Transcript_1834/g.5537  ORF Transcript_1834/g.5537 Transcript_1834/m.5537 type:complete len:323 (-) Transcript_1834:312-1280(-)